MGRMDYRHLLISENVTTNFTANNLHGFDLIMPEIIDLLLQLQYFCKVYKKAKGSTSFFNSYCFHQYLQIPYSLRAAFILCKSGYYFEATFIIRYLMEILAKMKYLRKHKNYINNIWLNDPIFLQTKKGKRKLTLRDIFEEVSPGAYRNYGILLSNFQHGGTGTMLFRTERNQNKISAIKMGSVWDDFTSSFVVNNIIMLSYSIINNFPTFFQRGFKKADGEILFQYEEVMKSLKSFLKAHKKEHPKSRKWYRELAGLLKKN
ncbi:MAG: hypothetical protein Q7R43_00335 [Candidatus Daviesbacteria bacterium]|nr:hypothetical protein [Candidatus Daviesbacteria bacterium]